MVVYDLDVRRAGLGPPEADPILFVDPDTVLAVPVALQLLEARARRLREVPDRRRMVQIGQPRLGTSAIPRGSTLPVLVAPYS